MREVEATTRALADLGVLGTAPAPVLVFEDNQCALQVANGHTSLSRAKAIDLRRAVVCQAVQRELIRVEYIDTKKMLADILTKQPPADAFEAARTALGILIVGSGWVALKEIWLPLAVQAKPTIRWEVAKISRRSHLVSRRLEF